ncbi:MAG: RDD family protein [Thermoleophilaceae bacterium]|nr:RDD family protein [Thermoleophilaceae bacterium]
MPPGGWQQQAAAAAPQTWQGPLASWGNRVAAQLIDGLIVFAALIPLVGVPAIGFAVSDALGIVLIILGGLVWLVFAFMYSTWLMKREAQHNGQTWGKQAMSIRVTQDNGQPFDLGSAAMRQIVIIGFGLGIAGSFTAGLAYLVDYLWPLFDDENRALHDMLAKTHVVKA